jgi:hypothetical protein
MIRWRSALSLSERQGPAQRFQFALVLVYSWGRFCMREIRLMLSPLLTARLLQPLALCLLLASPMVQAQRLPLEARNQFSVLDGNLAADPDGSELRFARLVYGGNQFDRGYMGRGRWTTDWPEAEHFFMEGLTRLTRVDGAPVSIYNGEGGEQINLVDGTVFDYPWLYGVEVGYWTLNPEEATILREYLLKGGFLMVDDFHGTREWSGFVATMQKVFPDRPIVDIPEDDEVFHVLYDLDEKVQVPGLASLYNGVTYEQDGFDAYWRGIYDDEGRLVVAINHNMDLGDAWEHADTPGYPEPMTALAYRFAVNYVIYAMTH